MSDTDLTPETQNAFEAPKADLSTPATSNPILEMKRFTAWGVFGLSMITLGLYYLYWLFTRTKQINLLSKVAKVNVVALYVYIAATLISNVGQFALNQEALVGSIFTFVISIASLVAYIMTVFSARKALQEVINEGSQESVKLGGILTFFFSAIYFQYKINEAIDNQSE
jgi:predicted membrane channel-forming protein YqfA (hemolysin III family)